MKIELDDLSRPVTHALLNEHLQSMYELSPPESVHALAIEQLRKPDITFWSAWEGSVGEATGAGANPGKEFRLNEHFEMFVPTGRAITKTNLEGIGVRPDIEVPETQALKRRTLPR